MHSEQELGLRQLGVELWTCPHCRKCGTLIGHGHLRGYEEHGQRRVVRGRRLFCSNRGRKRGCGRTLSVKLATAVCGFVVRTLTLFRFMRLVSRGVSRRAAWLDASAGALSLSSGYRLWRRLCAAQSAIRTRLCQQIGPPACSAAVSITQLLAHLSLVVGANASGEHIDLFAAYQSSLGRGLFDR